MIKKVFYLIAATIVFANCSNAPQAPTSFVVEGTLPDSSFHGEQIYMQRYTDGKTMGVTKVEGNHFTFTGVADSADYCRHRRRHDALECFSKQKCLFIL